MVVRHCGHTAVVKVPVEAGLEKISVTKQEIHIEEQPEGGSNSLNVNRYLLEKISSMVFVSKWHS